MTGGRSPFPFPLSLLPALALALPVLQAVARTLRERHISTGPAPGTASPTY